MIDRPFLTSRQEKVLSWVIVFLIVILFVALIALWAYSIFLSFDHVRRELLVRHFPAFVGLPAAGAASFILIFLFRQVSGPVELQIFGIKFKGAEGPCNSLGSAIRGYGCGHQIAMVKS